MPETQRTARTVIETPLVGSPAICLTRERVVTDAQGTVLKKNTSLICRITAKDLPAKVKVNGVDITPAMIFEALSLLTEQIAVVEKARNDATIATRKAAILAARGGA